MTNLVNKINGKELTWRYVPTDKNPADLGSMGGEASKLTELWFKGLSWLSDPDKWPSDIVTKASEESESEAQLVKEIMQVAVKREPDELDEILILQCVSWLG